MIEVDRFKNAIFAIVREVFSDYKFGGVYEYRVDTCAGGTFSGRPTDPSYGLPNAKNWPVRPPVTGGVVTLPAGSSVLVSFINRDPSRPFVLAFSSGTPPTNVAITVDNAWTLDAATVTINGGVLGAARQTDTVQAGPFSGTITSASATTKIG